MNKFLTIVIAVILALSLAGCDDENHADVIGTWTANYGTNNAYELKLNIDYNYDYGYSEHVRTWVMTFIDPNGPVSFNGNWERVADTLELYDSYAPNSYSPTTKRYLATASLSQGKLFLTQNVSNAWADNNFRRPETITLTKGNSSSGSGTLQINNQSSVEITDVIWNNATFANSQYENSIKSGTVVNQKVQAGGGYIFFKRKTDPIFARTNDIIIIEKNKQINFNFLDNTLIVETHNSNNIGTLRTLQSTVVWYDDAEGPMLQYFLRQNFAGYYSRSGSGLLVASGVTNSFHLPKNGNNSIAIGGTDTALLHLKINLSKKAKLSFWYANKWAARNDLGAVFTINEIEKQNLKANIDWSFIEFDLEPGVNDLIWKKEDGGFVENVKVHNYLSLDDILIYYAQ